MIMDSKNKRQITKNKNFAQALGHAWDGFYLIFFRERNFRIHLVAMALVIIAGLVLWVNRTTWLWLLLACFLVLSAEILNTLVEYLVDLMVGPRFDPTAKKIKDIAAGGVLFTAGTAAVIGVIVLWPYLGSLLPV
ncbi:diacylglycerol kinase family protein [Fructilactobacillus cliffordii]|uniref:Diacylglycerol kinase family protein n=2 Tax=Fructilactobacillus cliffordii TaxID=2940299 RepID=A0A9Q8ZV06_9LACO|nr:diacylglycerol kinase family protein [Fructilactobacillus cliffordii]USS89910.1 diacylglycerol kinase family protein [Fructilactobacillus cliffordii]